ncbi:hypothetical protein ZWY2020_037982 [Hordeum vulgare]|nr:hypothetical protein ZWY2020_037982 [Hordeum vulgare]
MLVGPAKIRVHAFPSSLCLFLDVAPAHQGRGSTARLRGEKEGKNGRAEFFQKDGVVDDMDRYLNYLSLEYESVWDTNPAWYVFLAPSSFLSV